MNRCQENLLQLVGSALFEQHTDAFLNDEVKEEARQQAVLGLVDSEAYQVFSKNVQNLKAHTELKRALKDVPFVIIKGYASAYYYPEPYKRTMGDVDFYVEPENFSKVEDLICQSGFEFEHETEMHRCFHKWGISFEMHHEFNGVPDGDVKLQRMLEDIIQTSREVELKNDLIRIPDDFHNGLICLLHICSHLSRSELGLRHFCDWACFVNSVVDFESLFRTRLEQVGLWRCACVFSLAAVKYLGLPYQEWMGERDDETVDYLIEELLDSGNMGRKQTSRENQWFVDKKGSGSKVTGLISKLNAATRKHWPKMGHCIFFYPIGWVYFPIRYIFWRLSGKRKKVSITEAIRQADKKNKLLEDLRILKA